MGYKVIKFPKRPTYYKMLKRGNVKMKKRKVTINDIQENLFDLDTEYREALAETLMKLKYIKYV